MKTILRKEAKAQGLTHYFTGVACKHGHTTQRNTKTGMCLACGAMWQAKLRENPEFLHHQREQTRAINKSRYKTDTAFRKQKLETLRAIPDSNEMRRERYRNSESKKARKSSKHIARWNSDPSYKVRVKSTNKRRNAKMTAERGVAILNAAGGRQYRVAEVSPGVFQPEPI